MSGGRVEESTALQGGSLPNGVEPAAYRLQRVQLANVGPAELDWDAFLERNPSGSPMHDLRWLREHFAGDKAEVFLYFLYQGDTLSGLATLFARAWPVKCQVGEITLARLPLRRLCVAGRAIHFPEDPKAYELLFDELLSRELSFDAVYLEDVSVDSFVWKFAETHDLMRRHFSQYVPDAPRPRILLRLAGSFETYIEKFSAKHRKNLKRTIRLFEEQAPGETEWKRFTRPEEVESFVDQAFEISQKTYQWNLLGLGLRSPEEIKKHLIFMAGQGWLRAYLLLSRGQACAFVIGFQYGSHYYLDDMGYDPAWRDYSVGKILQLKAIEDLFTYNRPEVYDLGEYGPHKEEFGTENYSQGKMFLFRHGFYPAIVRAGHRGCAGSTTLITTLLEWFGLKRRLKKVIRMWSSRS